MKRRPALLASLRPEPSQGSPPQRVLSHASDSTPRGPPRASWLSQPSPHDCARTSSLVTEHQRNESMRGCLITWWVSGLTPKGQGLHCADLKTGTVTSESDHLRCRAAVQRETRGPRSPGSFRCGHRARRIMNPTATDAPTTAVMFSCRMPLKELYTARHRSVHVRCDASLGSARRCSQSLSTQRRPKPAGLATTLTFG